VNTIKIGATAEFGDMRGNNTEEPVIRFIFTRSNAATIHWDKVYAANMPKLADVYWIHPGMAK
jgi:hypothetical protein